MQVMRPELLGAAPDVPSLYPRYLADLAVRRGRGGTGGGEAMCYEQLID